MSRILNVGLIGCGAIGTYIAKALVSRFQDRACLAYVTDVVPGHAEALVSVVEQVGPQNHPSPAVVDTRRLIDESDLVIEAAHPQAVRDWILAILANGKSVLVMSVGGLLDIPNLSGHLARSEGVIYVPSGAVAGVDGLAAAMQDGLESVTLITRKPLRSLAGAPGITSRGIDLESVEGETVVFEGSAREAVRAFPQNVNVSAVLSLATLGPDRVQVRIITSPHFTRNSHEVIARGAFGEIRTLTENVPSPDNPKTSALAQHSLAALLEKIFSRIKIGT